MVLEVEKKWEEEEEEEKGGDGEVGGEGVRVGWGREYFFIFKVGSTSSKIILIKS